MIILGKLDISFHENLLSASKHFRSGIENNCLLSLIEGLRNFVANPNAEISPDAGNDNREKAEINLKMLQLSIPVQLNHYRMKALLLSHIENVKRTSSVLSDSDIMRIIVKKLDQENIFRNIESNWEIRRIHVLEGTTASLLIYSSIPGQIRIKDHESLNCL